MTRAELIASYHSPDAWKDRMVYSVWEDGEITQEKGGELFGQRKLHTIASGEPAKAWPVELFPTGNVGRTHGRIFCKSDIKAMEFSSFILNWK
jgi:hypothetical protein